MNMKKELKPIPKFKSYEEEASFWDNNASMEYFDYENPIIVRGNKTNSFTIKLDNHDREIIRRIADRKRLSSSALVRSWIAANIEDAVKVLRA